MKRLTMILMILGAMFWTCPMIHAENKKSEVKTEQVSKTSETDKNPIVGKPFKGKTIRQGAKGGLYWWHIPQKGKNAGKQVKRYLSKAEKEEFYKENPNVKRPTNN